ncbi:MAG TPA: DUF309 domain-containing protein [Thermoanaerobaculia bacterium]|nr:DUF309 domain-containing protein [Thermoanaerobaculia bacterium]
MARVLHPELTAAERRALARAGVDHFNSGRYFEAHEAWEEIWRSRPAPERPAAEDRVGAPSPPPGGEEREGEKEGGSSKDLWRGLIQVAVGLYHHLERGNPAAARRVMARGLRRLERFPQGAEGFDLDALRAAARAWEEWLARPEGDPPPLPRVASAPRILPPAMPALDQPTEGDLRPYEVWAHDAFHLDGEAERYRVGGFADCGSAREACRNVVSDFLQGRYRSGMSADELYALYQAEGSEPFIASDDPDCVFAAADYARRLADEICG